MLHIADRYGAGVLQPTDAAGRAQTVEWAFAALNTIEPAIMDWSFATIFERGEPWSAPRLPSVEQRVGGRLDELARRLGDREWLDGAFSAGDLLMVAVLRIIGGTALLDDRPTLADYVARGEARPAFRRALDAQMAGFTGQPLPGHAARAARQGEKQ